MIGIHIIQIPYLVCVCVMAYGTERAVRLADGFRLFGLSVIYGSFCRFVKDTDVKKFRVCLSA